MGKKEEILYRSVEKAMADVKINAAANDCFHDDDREQIYELAERAVNEAKTSYIADATARAIRYYIEEFHGYILETLNDPEKSGEFTEAVRELLKDLKGG